MHNKTLNALKKSMTVMQAENAAITYSVNWAGLIDTDTISTSTWTAENSGSTIANEANTTTIASARLSGTPGRYLFTNKVVLAGGDSMERQITLIVTDNDSDYCHYCH